MSARGVAALAASVIALTAAAAFADPEAPVAPADVASAAPAETAAPSATPLATRSSHKDANQEPKAERPLPGFAPDAGMSASTKVILALLVLGGAFWAWKRRSAGQAPAQRPRTLKITARAGVGVRSELLLVDVEGQTLLLGVTPNSIQRLAVIPNPAVEAQSEAEFDIEPGFVGPRFSPPPPNAFAMKRMRSHR